MKKWVWCFSVGLLVQAGAYWYLDGVLFSPDSDFSVAERAATLHQDPSSDKFGQVDESEMKYYSYDRSYVAVVEPNSVKVYPTDDESAVQEVDLNGREVSFFEWLPDRNLVLMAQYDPAATDTDDLMIIQYNPDSPDHELDTSIGAVPAGSKITSMAYSTATNAVYMKMYLDEGRYRIYRTDANYDTRRIYVRAENIGRIAVFYDEDKFVYDDATDGVIYLFNGSNSSWRIISPPGFYRLVGIDSTGDIYAARMEGRTNVVALYRGQLGIGFEKVVTLNEPVAMSDVTISYVKRMETEQSREKDKE